MSPVPVSAVPLRGARGRPSATTHDRIEQVAFRLFAERGFEATSLELIASEVGVGRRTLFRYFPSKNDIPWGLFDRTVEEFARTLGDAADDVPLWEVVHRGVVAFNDFPPDADPPHDQRMRMILLTPALQAHSVLRYRQWREVIAAFVAARTATSPDDLLPRTAGHVSLALSLAAYDTWLADTSQSLPGLVDESMRGLRAYLR